MLSLCRGPWWDGQSPLSGPQSDEQFQRRVRRLITVDTGARFEGFGGYWRDRSRRLFGGAVLGISGRRWTLVDPPVQYEAAGDRVISTVTESRWILIDPRADGEEDRIELRPGPMGAVVAKLNNTTEVLLHKAEPGEDASADELPGINELRMPGTLSGRDSLWDMDVSGAAASNAWLIRFGSPLEIAIHKVMYTLALFNFFIVPFVTSFDYVYPLRADPTLAIADACLTLLYAAGVAVRFRTTFIKEKGVIECTDPSKLVKELVRQWNFRMDIVALVAAPFLHVPGFLSGLCYLRLFTSWRLLPDPVRTRLLTLTGTTLLQRMMRVTLFFYGATHLYGCIWFNMKMMSPSGLGHEWSAWSGWAQDVFNIEDVDRLEVSTPIEPGGLSDLYTCYARSVKDGIDILVGLSCPAVMSNVELMAMVVLGPLSGLIMSYVCAMFVSVLNKQTLREERFEEQMSVLIAACTDMNLTPNLKQRIVLYLNYLEVHQMGQQARDIMDQLSINLSLELTVFKMRDVILTSSVFSDLPSRLVFLLISTVNEAVFSPDDIIVRKGEIGDCMYIILRGSVGVYVDDAMTSLVVSRTAPAHFGEICFLEAGVPRTAWIVAQSWVVLCSIDKNKFDALMDDQPDMKHMVLKRIADMIPGYHTKRPARDSEGSENAQGNDKEDDVTERTPLMSERSGPPTHREEVPSVQLEVMQEAEVGQPAADGLSAATSSHGTSTLALGLRRASLLASISRRVSVGRPSGRMSVTMRPSDPVSEEDGASKAELRGTPALSLVRRRSLFVPRSAPAQITPASSARSAAASSGRMGSKSDGHKQEAMINDLEAHLVRQDVAVAELAERLGTLQGQMQPTGTSIGAANVGPRASSSVGFWLDAPDSGCSGSAGGAPTGFEELRGMLARQSSLLEGLEARLSVQLAEIQDLISTRLASLTTPAPYPSPPPLSPPPSPPSPTRWPMPASAARAEPPPGGSPARPEWQRRVQEELAYQRGALAELAQRGVGAEERTVGHLTRVEAAVKDILARLLQPAGAHIRRSTLSRSQSAASSPRRRDASGSFAGGGGLGFGLAALGAPDGTGAGTPVSLSPEGRRSTGGTSSGGLIFGGSDNGGSRERSPGSPTWAREGDRRRWCFDAVYQEEMRRLRQSPATRAAPTSGTNDAGAESRIGDRHEPSSARGARSGADGPDNFRSAGRARSARQRQASASPERSDGV